MTPALPGYLSLERPVNRMRIYTNIGESQSVRRVRRVSLSSCG
jgi:hypothetical protein